MDIATGGTMDRSEDDSGGATVTPIRADVEPPPGESGFEDWYRGEHPRLVGALFVVTGNLGIARDAVDEAFARALERWARVGKMESPSGWVFRVALNVSRRAARRAELERRLLRRHAPDVELPAPAGEIWTIVSTLPRREREVVVLRHLGGLAEAEIGACLGISRSTVSTTLRSAHDRLHHLLDDGDLDHD